MKLKILSKIDYVISTVFVVVVSPVWLVAFVLGLLKKPFVFVLDWPSVMHHRVVNGLVKYADEVKDGTIANSYYIRNCTAKQLYHLLKEEEETK